MPTTWKDYPIKQPPNYPNEEELSRVTETLSKCSPLVFAGEVRTLQEELAKVSLGQGFMLMGGDCAESFKEFSVNHVRDTLRVILQMSLVLTFGASLPGVPLTIVSLISSKHSLSQKCIHCVCMHE